MAIPRHRLHLRPPRRGPLRQNPVPLVSPPEVALNLSRLVGLAARDVLLTRDELDGLRADLLVSYDPPTAPTSFRAWVEEHGDELGRTYSSELARHYRR